MTSWSYVSWSSEQTWIIMILTLTGMAIPSSKINMFLLICIAVFSCESMKLGDVQSGHKEEDSSLDVQSNFKSREDKVWLSSFLRFILPQRLSTNISDSVPETNYNLNSKASALRPNDELFPDLSITQKDKTAIQTTHQIFYEKKLLVLIKLDSQYLSPQILKNNFKHEVQQHPVDSVQNKNSGQLGQKTSKIRHSSRQKVSKSARELNQKDELNTFNPTVEDLYLSLREHLYENTDKADQNPKHHDRIKRDTIVPVKQRGTNANSEIAVPPSEPVPESEAKPEHEPESEAEHGADSEPEHEPESEPDHAAEPEPEHEAESKPEHEAEPEPEHEAEPEPEHEAESEPEHEIDAQAEVEPGAEAEAWPEPGPEWELAFERWKLAWPGHVVFFSLLFIIVSLTAVLIVALAILERGCRRCSKSVVALSMLVFSCSISRTLFLVTDAYGHTGNYPILFNRLVFSLGLPGFTASFMNLLLIILDTTKATTGPPRFLRLKFILSLYAVHMTLVVISDVMVYTVQGWTSGLLFACQMLFVIYGVTCACGFFYVERVLNRNLAASKNAKDPLHARLLMLRFMSIASGCVAMCLTVSNLYMAVGDMGVFSDQKVVDPWEWWALQTTVRLLECLACFMVLLAFLNTAKAAAMRNMFLSKFGCVAGTARRSQVAHGSTAGALTTVTSADTQMQSSKVKSEMFISNNQPTSSSQSGTTVD